MIQNHTHQTIMLHREITETIIEEPVIREIPSAPCSIP